MSHIRTTENDPRPGHRLTLFALAAYSFSNIGSAAQTATFSVQLLGNIPGGTGAYVAGINEGGTAVGSIGTDTGSACAYGCAVAWQNGSPSLLAPDAAFGSQALALNNAGQVAGNVYMKADDPTAVVWSNGTPTVLAGPSQQYTNTFAYAINDAGQVAGYATESNEDGIEAIEWNGATPTVLGTERGCSSGSYAKGINNHGVVVGVIACPASDEATVWQGTIPTLLSAGKPAAINDAGLIVGVGLYGATAWINGVVRHLGTGSVATAVNGQGMIVGKIPGPRFSYHAALWSNVGAAPQDLNQLIGTAAGQIVLTEATGINGSCDIVANGFLIKDSVNNVAFLLKPMRSSSCAAGS